MEAAVPSLSSKNLTQKEKKTQTQKSKTGVLGFLVFLLEDSLKNKIIVTGG